MYYRFDKHESLLRRKGKTSSDILRRKKGVSKESKDISSLFANESLTAFLDRADIRERGSFTRSFRVSFSIYHLSLSLVRSFLPSLSHDSPILRLCRFRLYLAFKISRVRPICNSVGEKKRKEKKRKDEGTTMKTDELFIRFLE